MQKLLNIYRLYQLLVPPQHFFKRSCAVPALMGHISVYTLILCPTILASI